MSLNINNYKEISVGSRFHPTSEEVGFPANDRKFPCHMKNPDADILTAGFYDREMKDDCIGHDRMMENNKNMMKSFGEKTDPYPEVVSYWDELIKGI